MKKSYYIQVKELALPLMESYQSDLLKHDRRELAGYMGDFIHVTRPSGTELYTSERYYDITQLNPDEYHQYIFGKVKGSELLKHHHEGNIEIFNCNTYKDTSYQFLHGRNGVVKVISRERSIDILDQWYKQYSAITQAA